MPIDESAARAAWDHESLRDPHRRMDKARRVQAMFDAIAPRYELVNRVATFGRDATWRRRAVAAAAVLERDVVLDIACGTGDMIRAFGAAPRRPARVIGLDFAAGMLAAGVFHARAPVTLLRADAQRLPLADQTVDVISCAFGVRNFQRLDDGLAEMRRVLRPGGRIVILEFATPSRWFLRIPYRFYCEWVLPRLGSWLSRDTSGAYQYLPRSVATFHTREALERCLTQAGFAAVESRTMNFGGVVLFRARRE